MPVWKDQENPYAYHMDNAAAFADFPAAGDVGRIWRRTDGVRGLWMDSGDRYFPMTGGFINTEEMAGADLGARFNAAVARIPTTGGIIIIPPGTYSTSTELSISASNNPIAVWAYGAVIQTSGAIAGIKIAGGSTVGSRSIFGLKIDHRDNTTATWGFNIEAGWNVRLYDPIVVANNSLSTYAAIRVANSDAADSTTGSLWTKIINPWIRKFAGADTGTIPIGVLIEGNGNATTVFGGGINNTDTGVLIRNQGAGTAIPNAAIVDGVAFEGYTTGIHLTGPATGTIAGMRWVNNRFENGTTVHNITGVTSQPAVQPYLAGNFLTSNAGTYLNNPNSIRVNQFDFSVTPDIGVPHLYRGIQITPEGGSEHSIELNLVANSARGLKLDAGATLIGQIVARQSGATDIATFEGTTGSVARLEFVGVRSISGGTANVRGNNLRGLATFSSSSTVSVSFGTAEPDATYFVSIGGGANETFWVTGKGTSGFTLNSSNGSSTATVDWVLIR